jgi:hypothetical protein
MKMTRLLYSFVAVLAMIPASAVPAEGESRVITGEAAAGLFVYRNQPIHPFCVDFPWDSARRDPIVLSRCSDTKVVPAARADGWLAADYPREDGPYMSQPFASYRVLARKGDRFLIAIAESGGGTGKFTRLRWLRLGADHVSIANEVKGGDRCVGGLSGYAVKGGFIEFNQSLPASAVISLTGVAIEKSIHGQLRGAPPDCDATASYQYDPATERMQLLSVALHEVRVRSGTADSDPQACFDRLVRQRGKSSVLTPGELKEFGQVFASTCVPEPRR